MRKSQTWLNSQKASLDKGILLIVWLVEYLLIHFSSEVTAHYAENVWLVVRETKQNFQLQNGQGKEKEEKQR